MKSNQNPKLRPILTFVRRERMSQNRRENLGRLLIKYAINLEDETQKIEPQIIFGRKAPLYLEIGFGTGEVLFSLASQYPQYNFIGIEVYRPGVEKLLSNVEANELNNVRVIVDDARHILKHNIADKSLDGILIFFPDPWPKLRHHKRRLIQPEFVNLAAEKLTKNGYIHFASDIANYVEHAKEVFTVNPKLIPISNHQAILPRPTSKFARRGDAAGRTSQDIIMALGDNVN